MLRSDFFYAPPPEPAIIKQEGKMKVKFLKEGRWAHKDITRGQFDFSAGQEMDGIDEVDAMSMKKAGTAEIISYIEVEEPEENENSEDEEEDDSSKPWD